jgi:ABC-type uncharacterized transport system permease subunit
MTVPQLPVWSAYLLAPALIAAASWNVIMRSESPFLLLACAIGSGLVCAGAVHGYVAVKRKLQRQLRK